MSAARPSSEPLRGLVEESFEEAAFLWKRWNADLESLTRNLEAVWSWSEDRLHGALDGVRVGGAQMLPLAASALSGTDLSQAVVAAHLLAAPGPSDASELLITALRAASGPRLRALMQGIAPAELDGSFAPVARALAAQGPEHAAALCRLKAFHRSRLGAEVGTAFDSGIASVQAETLRALALSGEDAQLRYVEVGLESEHPGVRQAAIETGIRRRLERAWQCACDLAHRRSAESASLLRLLALLGSPDEQQSVVEALREPALRQVGVFALGYIGTPQAAEICLSAMRDPALARWAAEAYCAITGAELARDHLSAAEPDTDGLPPLAQDDLDASLVPRQSDLWPTPDADAVHRHWSGIKARYTSGVRHLLGRPVSLDTLAWALEHGPMLRRSDLALELHARTAGQYDVETRAFTRVQRQMLARGRAQLSVARAH
jgi:uncharacterized protein (TIGR02270 family)